MMSVVRRLAMSAAVAIAAAGSVPAAAMAATSADPGMATQSVKATPLISTVRDRCVYGSGRNNHTCFYIKGHGLYVNYMAVATCINRSARTIHEEITGPSFTLNSRQLRVRPGHCLVFRVPVKGNLGRVAAGTYHGIAWRYNGGSSYTKIADLSFPVHR
jgi:hypothetical protein